MKNLTLIALALLSFRTMSETQCPQDWQVTVIEKNNANAQDISIRIKKDLIKNVELMGDRELEISSQYSPFAEIKGDQVALSFVRKSMGKIKEETWSSLGTVIQTEVVENKTCHKIKLDNDVSFSEITESSWQDCMFLPKIFCGKMHYNSLKISKEINKKEFYTKSLSSILK